MAEFVSIAAARGAPGLRLFGLRGVPSPWTEAAKGIFHVKRLDFLHGARAEDEPPDALSAWAGDVGVPVVAFEKEKLRTGWAEILLLAERLAPEPALVPTEPEARALFFGLAHEICGEMGFGWAYRLLLIRDSLGHAPDGQGFPPRVGEHLAVRYGFNPRSVAIAKQRAIDVLSLLSRRIESRPFLLDETFTALDIYWATFANLVTPLPPEELPAVPMIRAAYTCRDADVLGAVSEKLRAHQRIVYERFLGLPVAL